ALVLSQPDVMFYTWEHLDDLVSAIEAHSQYAGLVAAVENQIATLGYLNLQDSQLMNYVTTIALDALTEFIEGRSGEENFPVLTPNSSGSLDYSHSGLNIMYAARMYEGNIPVSNVI